MGTKDIFISVGGTANDQQEQFVVLLEDRLRSEGLIPYTVGRNTFSVEAPLRTVERLIDRCAGTVVVALERSYFPHGLEKRGGDRQRALEEIRLATSWNHIEAAMSYVKRKPLLVIVEEGVKSEGLLEPGYDWYVQTVPLNGNALTTKEFNGVLASWKSKLIENEPPTGNPSDSAISPATMTIAQLIGTLKPAQLWSLLTALAALIVGAFALGGKLLA